MKLGIIAVVIDLLIVLVLLLNPGLAYTINPLLLMLVVMGLLVYAVLTLDTNTAFWTCLLSLIALTAMYYFLYIDNILGVY